MARSATAVLIVWTMLWAGVPYARAEPTRRRDDPASAGVAPPGYDDAVNRAFRAFEAAQYTEARNQFLEAHALFPNARTLRALGKVEYELSHYDSAFGYLEDALRSDERALTPEQRIETEQLCDQLRGYVSRVRVTVHPASARVTVDNGPYVARADGSILLTEGDHVVEVLADGYQAQRHNVHVIGGADQEVEISLLTGADVRAESGGEAHPRRKLWIWIGVGTALAAGIVAGTVVGLSKGSDAGAVQSGTTGVVVTVPESAAR